MGRETWEAKPKFSFSFLGTLQIPRGNSVWEKEELVMCVVALGSESEQEREREGNKRLFQNAARQSVLLCRFDDIVIEFWNLNFRF